MDLEKWKKIAGYSQILSNVIFWFLIFIAMLLYTGGTMDNPSITGYSFWGNTISDLGRIISYNGDFNIISMILFTIAVLTLAFLSVPLYIVFPKLFSTKKLELKSAQIGSLLGCVTIIGWIGVIFTPADIARGPHWTFAYVIYIAFFFSSVFYTISLYFNPKISKRYALLLAVFCIVFFACLMVILIGTPIARIYLVVAQKIAHIASATTYIILGYGIFKYKLD